GSQPRARVRLRPPLDRLPVLRPPERVPLERPDARPVARELLALARRVVPVRRDVVAPRERLRVLLVGRWSRGTCLRTTSLTSRTSSASRYFAIRSSSRRLALASWAVARSPASSANLMIR